MTENALNTKNRYNTKIFFSKELNKLNQQLNPNSLSHFFNFEKLLIHLNILKNQLEKSETALYRDLLQNLPGHDNAEKLQVLQSRIKEIEKNKTFQALINDTGNKILKKVLSSDVFDKLESNDYLEVVMQDYIFNEKTVLEEVKKKIFPILPEILPDGTKKAKRTKYNRTLLESLVYSVTYDKGKMRVFFKNTSGQKINTKTLKTVLEKDYNLILNTGNVKTDLIIDAFKELNDNSEIAQMILEELKNQNNHYDIFKNPNSIKGFFGEVRANVFFNYITKSKFAEPTGNVKMLMKDTNKKVDIPIDVLLREQYGVQVKNYAVYQKNGKNTVQFPHYQDTSMSTFINYQLNPSENLKKLLLAIFATQDVKSDSIPNPQEQKSQEDIHKLMLTNGNNPPIADIFNLYLINLLKVDNEMHNVTNKLFEQNKIRFNLIYMLNDQCVLASQIVGAVIEELRNKQESIISAKYYITPSKEPQHTYADFQNEQNHNAMASQSTIKYGIELNLDDIMKRVHKRMGQIVKKRF